MNHFLNKSAKHIFNQHIINELADICIVLPTRRGTLSFKKELASQSNIPFISPKIIAVEDFILEATNLQLMEPIDLVFELFKAFQQVDEKVKFELFMSWAPTLLKDFESIDQYLVNAKQLFAYMTEAKAMERWNVDQIKSKNASFETSVEKYFELFKTLHIVYENFNKNLKIKGLAYRGSAYRYLAENAETLLLDKPKYKKYYFLGFNALSLSENKIIKTLIDAKKAEILWDSDDYYMENFSIGQMAGRFLKETKKEAALGTDWKWQENALLKSNKNITIIGSPNTSLQPIIAANYLGKWADKKEQNVSTALILADETLLETVISQIPESVGNYNITMGLSLKESPIFGLLELVFDLHQFQKNDNINSQKFNTRLIIKLLSHSYLKKWAIANNINLSLICKNILDLNLLFLGKNELEKIINEEQLIGWLLQSWQESPIRAIETLKKLSKMLEAIFLKNAALDLQYLFHFNKIINRVEEIVNANVENINISGLKSILFEILKQTKLPFESNTTDNLQIMGMLETRTLDFERIILLSTNEGNLPSGKKSQSLIPFDALIELDMPTYGHQDAIMAYHFFRLLQRAKEVVIIFVEPNASNGNKEKSRFILQIEHELTKLNQNITIEYPEIELNFEKNEKVESDFEIEKTEEIVQKILAELQAKGLYATSINEFIRCEMLYYFNRIAKIEEPDEIDEYIGNDIFGLWVHKTLENIDVEILKNGGILEKETLIQIKNNIRNRLEIDFKNNHEKLSLEQGMNHILLNVAEKVLTGFFKNEIETAEFPQKIIAVEMSLKVETDIKLNDEILKIKVGGKIDKINKIGNIVRIIDYKTGKVENKKLAIDEKKSFVENIENILTKPEFDKQRQLWLYRYLFLKSLDSENDIFKNLKNELNLNIEAGIYSFRNNKAGFMAGLKYFTNESESNKEFIKTSEELIEQFVAKLVDKLSPFKMTNELKNCEYCSYKGICNR